MRAHVHHGARRRIFTEASFVITQKCERLRYPRTRDRKNGLWYTHTMEHPEEVSKLFLLRAREQVFQAFRAVWSLSQLLSSAVVCRHTVDDQTGHGRCFAVLCYAAMKTNTVTTQATPDESPKHSVEWKKTHKKYILCGSIYIKLKKSAKPIDSLRLHTWMVN